MEKIVSTLVDYIWGNGLVYLALAVGYISLLLLEECSSAICLK